MESMTTFYESVGGAGTFERLVREFYRGVAGDPILRPLYPEDELADAEVRLRMFLEQYWGGPRTYGEERGHPRLRMRHAPFTIGIRERDAWLSHMRTAVDSLGLEPEAERTLWNYLLSAAHSLVNAPETADEGGPAVAAVETTSPRLVADLTDRRGPPPPE